MIEKKFAVGIVFHILGKLPSLTMKIEKPSYIEIMTIEITICKNKILVAGIYKPPNLRETNFTTNLETIIRKPSNKYGKINFYGRIQYDYQ